MPSQMPAEQTYGSGHVLSQGFDEFVCNDGPLSPNPSPTRGRGDHRCQRISIEHGTSSNTFIHTLPIQNH
jgi:hypothetical protein